MRENELPQSKPDGFASSLGEGASGVPANLALTPETANPSGETVVQKRPQAFLNHKYKNIFPLNMARAQAEVIPNRPAPALQSFSRNDTIGHRKIPCRRGLFRRSGHRKKEAVIMSMNTVPERLAALRAAMAANGVAVYLIPVGDPHASEYLPCHYTSLTWFSGFHGENSNFVVTRTESALWADGRYFVQAEKEIAGTEIKLQRMGEPGVPTVEEYCANALNEGEALGLCGLTASTALVNDLKKALEKKGASIKTLNLEDELWTEGRPALPDTPAWILPKEYAGFSPAEKLDQLRSKLKELGCTAQFVGKLDNLAWLLNLRAMDIECTPYAMAYCYVTPRRAVLFINTARVTPEAKAELEANGITLAEYDDVLKFLAAETEPQTVLAECATVNYAVYQVLEQNPALTVKDGTDPLLMMKGVKNETELAHTKQAHTRDAVAMVRFQIEMESRLAAGETLTELTVDEILHKYRSADDKFLVESFGTIAAYGGNAAMMHYHATPEDHAKLQRKGRILTMPDTDAASVVAEALHFPQHGRPCFS